MSDRIATQQQRETLPSSSKQQPVSKSIMKRKVLFPAEEHQAMDQASLYRTITNPLAADPANIQRLQGILGNQTVSGLIQAKLTVGPVQDRYEQEADRVAEQIVSRPQSSQPSGGYTSASQPLTETDGGFVASPVIESRLTARQGMGQPLPSAIQSLMESQFSADLSQVRIHTDSEAGRINQELEAEAFTHGNDIYMAEGRYSPHSSSGQRLLAHELTHVIQQGGTSGPQTPSAIQRWPWSKKKKEEAPPAGAAAAKAPAAPPSQIPIGLGQASYMKWLQTHPGLLSDKERSALGIKMPAAMHMSDQQMASFDQQQQNARRKELNALAPAVGPGGEHSQDEAGDVASMVEDPRFKARYEVDRGSDHGNFLARKLKRGKEVAGAKFKEIKSYLPGQHSVVPGEDFAQQSETKGEKAKRIAKTAAVMGGKKLLGSIPLLGTGMNVAAAVKEGQRQKTAEKVSDTADQSPQADTMNRPFLSSMSEGLATDHYNKKADRAFDAAVGAVNDAVTITGAVLSGGASLGVTEGANAVFKEAVKPVIKAGMYGAKAGWKLGKTIAGATMDDRQYRMEASSARSDQGKGSAVGKLAAEDPDFAQAMLKHLAPGQMSVGHELYTNNRIQEPQGDHTLKPSAVARLGRQEKSRLRERERMGADAGWTLEGENQQAETAKRAAKSAAKGPAAVDPRIPAAPALPARPPQAAGPKRENLLGRLLKSEEEQWYET
ncbi:MAG: DUF4157 domain-containing protein [Methylocystaceae bacterium]